MSQLELRFIVQDGSQASQLEEEARDPAAMSGVLVSLRSLAKFVSSHVVSPTTLAGEPTHNHGFCTALSYGVHRNLPEPLHHLVCVYW